MPTPRPLTVQRTQYKAQSYLEPLDLAAGDLPLRLMVIPAGEFLMGSPGEEGGYDDEKPQHLVVVPRFLLGQYPVTQAQWRAVAAMPQQRQILKPDPSEFKGNNRPVECVSWEDAVEFCARLAAQTQRAYGLPSEAEWEYACRAGTQTPFFFGETLTPELANYDCGKTYGKRGVKGEIVGETSPVDIYQVANFWGLSDMHGNVWEWCEDDWHGSYAEAPQDGSSWISRYPSTVGKIRRGGSWLSDPGSCCSTVRYHGSRSYRNPDIGFRVACSVPRPLTHKLLSPGLSFGGGVP
jgi:formylglycine-generating enzyme required for sulfatase activity